MPENGTTTSSAARRWIDVGTGLIDEAIADLSIQHFRGPCALPDWSRGHVLSHVAANAEALSNLVRWAATGIETPMYASADDRRKGIEKGSTMGARELVAWFARSDKELQQAMDQLTEEQWQTMIVTAQGRTVPATEIPWLRAREVNVHAVDLAAGVTFADLPDDFCEALIVDILAKRGMDELPAGMEAAPRPEVAAWLAGRTNSLTAAPQLDPWL